MKFKPGDKIRYSKETVERFQKFWGLDNDILRRYVCRIYQIKEVQKKPNPYHPSSLNTIITVRLIEHPLEPNLPEREQKWGEEDFKLFELAEPIKNPHNHPLTDIFVITRK